MFAAIAILEQNANAQVSPISLVRLDFDTGDLSQWTKGPKTTTSQNNCNEHDYPGTKNLLQVVTSPVKQGTHALKVTLANNAIVIPGTGVNGERAEVKYCDSPNHVHLFKNGEDLWFHWYTDFSFTNFNIPTPIANKNWHVWTQWHGLENTVYDLPLAFNLNGNLLNLRVLPHFYDSKGCFTIQAGQCGHLWVEKIVKGKWYEILLHVKWSTGSNGFVEGWIKKDGGSKIPFIKYKGNTLNPNGSAGVYLKQGLYRNPAINVLQVVWHDGMVIAKCPTNTQFNPSTNKCDSTTTIIGNDTSTTIIENDTNYHHLSNQTSNNQIETQQQHEQGFQELRQRGDPG